MIDLSSTCLIFLHGRLMRITTTFQPFLSSLMARMTFELQHRGRRKHDFYTEPVACFDVTQVNGVPHIKTGAGFYEAVLQMAYDFGMEVHVVDQARNVRIENPTEVPVLPFRIPVKEWEESRPWQKEAVRYMNSFFDGRIKVAPGGGKSHLIKKVCRWLPDSKILVIDRSKTRIDSLASAIMSETATVGVYHSSLKCHLATRVIVCSLGCLEAVSHLNWDLVLADELHELVTPEGAAKLGLIRAKRAYGLSANLEDRADNADMWAEAWFGPIRLRREYADVQADGDVVPIYVQWIDCEGPSVLESKGPKLQHEMMRNLIWRNQSRNRAFAEKAQQYYDEGRQVLVLTVSTEHALIVAKMLGWPVVAKLPIPSRRAALEAAGFLRPDELVDDKLNLKLQQDFAARRIRGVVANRIWHTGLDFRSLDVLVRMDSLASEIMHTQLPGRLSRTFPGKKFGLLIDSRDSFDHAARARAEHRESSYGAKGWLNATAAQIASWR